MNPSFSPNTQAILLLTAPLIAGRAVPSTDLLTPGEYKRLARHLHQLSREPADLLSETADEILRDVQPLVDAARLQRLLARGFALSQAIERWQTRAIWVVSRADPDYPQRLRERLKDDRPAVLYGCGERAILDSGGLAVVGSRDVDDALVEYTQSIGRLAARARKTLVSGGARGIDQAAMRGALEAGGKVSCVMADSLEKAAMNRENRSLLMDGQLVLVSPYDPSAGFSVGNAMQRNKLIYALSDAALVMNADFNKGGTWAGAVEQLDKLKLVTVYVRCTGTPNKGLDGLRQKGALPWPNPEDSDGLDQVFSAKADAPQEVEVQVQLFGAATVTSSDTKSQLTTTTPESVPQEFEPVSPPMNATSPLPEVQAPMKPADESPLSPADEIFSVVRRSISRILAIPKKESEIATELQVTPTQAREWLQRLIDDGAVEKGPKKSLYQLPGRLI
jgi:predicted Rossmann fold nucleotide-binding protein DprA/Smf involved in DNA uptake